MYELIHCKCGLIYGERPETYSSSNPHPHNFCPECDHRGYNPIITMADVEIEYCPESVWSHTTKHHFYPNWLNG